LGIVGNLLSHHALEKHGVGADCPAEMNSLRQTGSKFQDRRIEFPPPSLTGSSSCAGQRVCVFCVCAS
jgi:hypothetical protein